jgi:hypothetical protein
MPSATPTELTLQARCRDAPARLDLRDPLEHARFLFGVEQDGWSLVVLDERESGALGETCPRPDGATNNSAHRDLHEEQSSRPLPREP